MLTARLLRRQRRAGAGSPLSLCGKCDASGNGSRGITAATKQSRHAESPHARVVNTNTLTFLAQTGTPHNVVFVDPPFRKGLLEETLTLLETHGWLANEAYIYVESEVENGLPPVPVNWSLYREKVAGQVAYRLYQREARGEHDAD